MDRQESKRVHHEMERFYQKHPEYKIQANHIIFLDAAEEDGGSELLTAEWMELQLDSLRGQLALLKETPAQALDKFMRAHPELNCIANRNLIAEYIQKNYGTVEQAVTALADRLAVYQDIADEQLAQQQAQERASLIEEIVADYSPSQFAQDVQRKKLQGFSIERLQAKAQEIRDRRFFRSMSKEELKAYLRQQRDLNTPAPLELPAEITADAIKRMDPNEIRRLNRIYGRDVVNARLGYVKPEIGGDVRQVNLVI